MRLHFDSKGNYRGHSSTPREFFYGWCVVLSDYLGVLLWLIFAPIATVALITRVKNGCKVGDWNPIKNPIPFIIINIIWALFWYAIISGKYVEYYYSEHPKCNKEYAYDETTGMWGYKDKEGNFSEHPFE